MVAVAGINYSLAIGISGGLGIGPRGVFVVGVYLSNLEKDSWKLENDEAWGLNARALLNFLM